MSKNKGGRRKEAHTDILLEVIRNDLRHLFVDGQSFTIPESCDIEKFILNHDRLRSYSLNVGTVKKAIDRYKSAIIEGFQEDLNVKISEVATVKFSGGTMAPATEALLSLVISSYHTIVSEKVSYNSVVYTEMLARSELKDFREELTPKKMHFLLYTHHKKLCKQC